MIRIRHIIASSLVAVGMLVVGTAIGASSSAKPMPKAPSATPAAPRTETATFSGGCFWSMNAIFERLKGVQSVTAGFSGGNVANPSYERVCTGSTGHAETVQIVFDPSVVSYRTLLDVFFALHDPTTPDRQGADVGTQYRSAIFYHSPEQKATIERALADLKAKHAYRAPIVTQVQPYQGFFAAEDYHQAYYDKNSDQMYCQLVIAPKLAKLRKLYGPQLKPGS